MYKIIITDYNYPMDIGGKKDLIFNCLRLGMELDRACYLAELTQEEMDWVKKDPTWVNQTRAATMSVEFELLKKMEKVIEINTYEGNSKEIRYMLGCINPKRWRNAGGAQAPAGGTINIFTEGRNPSDEDTVEVQLGKEI